MSPAPFASCEEKSLGDRTDVPLGGFRRSTARAGAVVDGDDLRLAACADTDLAGVLLRRCRRCRPTAWPAAGRRTNCRRADQPVGPIRMRLFWPEIRELPCTITVAGEIVPVRSTSPLSGTSSRSLSVKTSQPFQRLVAVAQIDAVVAAAQDHAPVEPDRPRCGRSRSRPAGRWPGREPVGIHQRGERGDGGSHQNRRDSHHHDQLDEGESLNFLASHSAPPVLMRRTARRNTGPPRGTHRHHLLHVPTTDPGRP